MSENNQDNAGLTVSGVQSWHTGITVAEPGYYTVSGSLTMENATPATLRASPGQPLVLMVGGRKIPTPPDDATVEQWAAFSGLVGLGMMNSDTTALERYATAYIEAYPAKEAGHE